MIGVRAAVVGAALVWVSILSWRVYAKEKVMPAPDLEVKAAQGAGGVQKRQKEWRTHPCTAGVLCLCLCGSEARSRRVTSVQ